MSTMVTVRTTDGRTVHGINYTLNATNLPSNVSRLTAAMPGGLTMGVYHLLTPSGWVYIPAADIAAIVSIRAGAPT